MKKMRPAFIILSETKLIAEIKDSEVVTVRFSVVQSKVRSRI